MMSIHNLKMSYTQKELITKKKIIKKGGTRIIPSIKTLEISYEHIRNSLIFYIQTTNHSYLEKYFAFYLTAKIFLKIINQYS